MDISTTLTSIRRAAATPRGRAVVRIVATASSLVGRSGHPVVAAAVAISADYLASLAEDPAEAAGR